jgi:hypothetical protein
MSLMIVSERGELYYLEPGDVVRMNQQDTPGPPNRPVETQYIVELFRAPNKDGSSNCHWLAVSPDKDVIVAQLAAIAEKSAQLMHTVDLRVEDG